MFGLIGKINATPDQGHKLAQILLKGCRDMPGNLVYHVALDAEAPDNLWVYELWESEAAHRASLQLASVQAAIAEGRPLIAGFEVSRKLVPQLLADVSDGR